MKLSEAMRIGASKRPKAIFNLFDYNEAGKLCSCALGAVYEGLTGRYLYPGNIMAKAIEDINFVYPEIAIKVKNPQDGLEEEIGNIIVTLNDSYNWSREEISDWLESIGY